MTFSEEEYYYKADNLIKHSCPTLQLIFRRRWETITGTPWNDESFKTFITGIGKKLYNNAGKIQKKNLRSGRLDNWDISLLSTVIQSTFQATSETENEDWRKENAAIQALAAMRNDSAHSSNNKLTEAKYEEIEAKFKTAMLNFDILVESEIDKLITNAGVTSSVTAMEQMKKITAEADQLMAEKKFNQAIKCYDEALMVPSLLPVNQGTVLEKRAECYFHLAKQQNSDLHLLDQAAKDAEEATKCNRESWMAHHITAKVLQESHDHERAIQHFKKALAISPGQTEVNRDLDICKLLHGQFSRDEHFYPRSMPMTESEFLKCINEETGLSLTGDHLQKLIEVTEETIPGFEHVYKGHQYINGWKVEQSYQEAARHLTKAASKNNAEGIHDLGWLYRTGKGVKQDIPYALELFRRAASLPPYYQSGCQTHRNVGVAEAQHALGLLYHEGVGVHKDLVEAAEWYMKAADIGSGPSANNLGIMYSEGEGVEKDEKKAEFYWKHAVEDKCMTAAYSLYLHYLKEFEIDAAKAMFDLSISLGNEKLRMIQKSVYKGLENRKQEKENMEKKILDFERKQGGLSIRGMSFVQRMDRMLESADPALEGVLERTRDLLAPTKTPKNWGGRFTGFDEQELVQRANEGSVTASRIIETLNKTAEFLYEWGNGPPFSKSKVETLIDILYNCLTIEHQVFFIVPEMRNDFVNLVHGAFLNTASVKCDFDRKLRLCFNYVALLTKSLDDDYHLLIIQEGVRRYPEDVHLHVTLSDTYLNRNDHKNGLEAAENGLKQFPDNLDLLLDFAVHLRLIDDDSNNNQKVRDAYGAFLTAAPADHRKVPEAYYAIGTTYMCDLEKPSLKRSSQTEKIMYEETRRIFEKGEEAEKKQLSCYLPYNCKLKAVLDLVLNQFQEIGSKEKEISGPDPLSSTSRVEMPPSVKTFLSDPKRVELITFHRMMLKTMKKQPKLNQHTEKPKLIHKIPSSLTDLRSIRLKEMDPTKDQIYENRLLNLTIIEDPLLGFTSVHLIAEDDVRDVTRLFVYNVPQNKKTSKKYGFGCRLSVINPYMRIAADRKNGIRVEDPKCLVFNKQRVDMCRYCGQENAPNYCAKCKWATYCSRECQVADWNKLKHKLICVPV